MESQFKNCLDVALRDMVWSGHKHGLMIGLYDHGGLSNVNDSMILQKLILVVSFSSL